jgi:ATP-dependent Clp protease, protease subunit
MPKKNNSKKANRTTMSPNLELFLEHSIDPKNRLLYWGNEEIEAESTERLIKGIYILNDLGSKPIRLLLNSPGGDMYQGWAAYDAINESKAPVNIEVYGHAMSMAAIILQSGNKRLIHPRGVIMIHDGVQEMDGEVRSTESWSDWGKKERKRIYSLFAEKTKKDFFYWENKFAKDTIFNAEQALEVGLVDKIIKKSL